MALDGVMLSIIKKHLEPLVSAKVEKVYQPSKYDLMLTLKQGGTKRLLFSCDPERSRVQMTEHNPENPKTPPMFCMLMRKHLCGAKLCNIRQDGLERALYFDFDAVNELGDNVVLTLCCEIMGRYSNIILINQDNKIIDAMRRVDALTSAKRLVLPGVTYEPPPKGEKRLDFRVCSDSEIQDGLLHKAANKELSKALVQTFEGISPLIAREWTFFALKGQEASAGELNDDQLSRLLFVIHETAEKIKSGQYEFNILKNKNGIMKEYTFMNIMQYGTLMIKAPFENLFEMLDIFYSQSDRTAIIKQKANDIFRILLSNAEKTSKRITVQSEELEQCQKKSEYKKSADLISSYLYMLKKGDALVYLDDFFEEETPKVKVELDPMLTPAENAQKYYKEYRKAVTAEKILTERIEKGREELVYFDSVLDALSRAENESDISQIRLELLEQGYIRKTGKKNKLPKEMPPMEFTSSDGLKILVGRNNKQNDKLTMKIASKSDYWLHTQDIPGSHVIIKTEGETPPDSTIVEAAELAAYHSKAAGSDKVPVDYCLVKYVKKPPESKPGMVIFSNNKTILVTPKILKPDLQ